jgi:hypothetical protein
MERFEIIRNEEEHYNNELHRFCRLVDYYCQFYEWDDAYRYGKWTMENIILKEAKEDDSN